MYRRHDLATVPPASLPAGARQRPQRPFPREAFLSSCPAITSMLLSASMTKPSDRSPEQLAEAIRRVADRSGKRIGLLRGYAEVFPPNQLEVDFRFLFAYSSCVTPWLHQCAAARVQRPLNCITIYRRAPRCPAAMNLASQP